MTTELEALRWVAEAARTFEGDLSEYCDGCKRTALREALATFDAAAPDGLTSDETDAISREVERNIGFDEGAAAERAALVADDAAIERVVKTDFMGYGVYGGYMQQAKESEWQRMRDIELNTFKRRLLALIERGDHTRPEPAAQEGET